MTTSHGTRPADVLEKFAREGLYLRMIDGTSELKSLKTNEAILKRKNISTVDDLKKFFDITDESQIAPLLDDFKFKPATFIKKKMPISPAMLANFGILMDPIPARFLRSSKIPSILAPYLYKKNVQSYRITSGNFVMSRPSPTRAKNVGTHANLAHKMQEYKDRYKGEAWDPYFRVFGATNIENNEALLTIKIRQIKGIVLTAHSDIREALKFRALIKKQTGETLSFFQYKINEGDLIWISEERIAEFKKNNAVVLDENSHRYPNFSTRYQFHLFTRDRFKNIKCSLANSLPPSKKHPIQYRFNLIDDKNQFLRCRTFFEKDSLQPVLSINNVKFSFTYWFIKYLIYEHSERLKTSCNELLQDKNIQKYLQVSSISLSINTTGKRYLSLFFTPVSIRDHDDKKLLEDIGYPDHCKFERMSSDLVNVHIRLAVLQGLDAMMNKLTALKEIAKEPAHKKARIR